MLDNERRVSSSSSHASTISEVWSRRAARFGTLALALAAVIALATLGAASGAGAKPAADDAGAQAFKSNCVVCHGADGTGTATGKSLKAPDLNSEAVQKMTDAQIVEQISNGKNNMPPFKSTLSKDQIQSLVVYLRATFGKKK
jgi:mono/diheme cytochrome c family protein